MQISKGSRPPAPSYRWPYERASDVLIAPCAEEGGTFRESCPSRPKSGPLGASSGSAVPAALYAFAIALFLALALVPIAGQRAALSDYAPALLLIASGLAGLLAWLVVRRRVAGL